MKEGFDHKIEKRGFAKIKKRKELEFCELIKKEAPKGTPAKHFYNITLLKEEQ